MFSHANTQVDDEILVGLKVNKVSLHKDSLLLRQGTKWYILCGDLSSTYIDPLKLIHQKMQGLDYCWINPKDTHADLNEDAQILELNFPTHYFLSTHIENFKKEIPPQDASFGAFANYDVYYRYENYEKDFQELNIQNDLAIFYKKFMFKNGLVHRYSPDATIDSNQTTRLYSQLNYELPNQLSYIQIGDNISKASALARSYYFAGLQWGTNFNNRPGYVYWNVPSISGTALAPSTIDLYIDGVKAYNGRINPGEFNIDNGAFANGNGSAQMIVEDVLGNKQVKNIDFFVSDRLLRKGLSDYNVAIGKLRYNYSVESNDYRDFFSSVYIRHGLNPYLTLGAQVEYSDQIQNLGLMWTNRLPKIGVLDLAAARSHSEIGNGNMYSAGIVHQGKNINWGMNSSIYDKSHRTLGMDKEISVAKLENFAYLGFSEIPVIDTLSFNYIEQVQHTGSQLPDNRIFSLRSNKNLSPDLSMTFGLSKNIENDKDLSFDFSLSYQFAKNKSINLNQTDDATLISTYKLDNAPVGIDYIVGLGHSQENQKVTFNTDTKLKSHYGDLQVRYLNDTEYSSTQLNYRGALSLLGNQVALTKMVEYPFTLVRVPGYADIDVFRNNLYVGKTNKNGDLFVHNLVPYSEQNIVIDVNQFNIDNKILQPIQTIVPYDLRGYVANFSVLNTKEIEFRLFGAEGQPLPIGSLVFVDSDLENPNPLGSSGTVVLYGLTEGKHKFKVITSTKSECGFEYLVDLKATTQLTPIQDIKCLEQ